MKALQSILLIIVLCISTDLLAENHGDREGKQKAVLVTGSNSGLGLKMTQELSNNGFYVYAGVLHKHEMAAMNKMKNVTAVQFDVRNQGEIDAAAKFVKAQGRGLYGLINNAGVGVFGPLLETPVEQLQYQMDVNVYGPFRVTQAFAPLIIESKGRIATTGSVAGIGVSNMFGIYSMSKHAIEAYTDGLAQEIARFGVSVHVIEPGIYKSNIGKTAKKLLEDNEYWKEDTLYKGERAGFYSQLADNSKHIEPIQVGKAALDIMKSSKPKSRYMVIERVEQADRVVRRQLSKLLELNDGQKHEFSRSRIVEMLDEEIEKRSSVK
jgi:NAD(P)-dependent dehydrogenase (short-subunit alcohol dehydrogenase family)